ncbi:MAG: HDOD domain-containing protein, partial [Methylococcaceae bacterium]|nr:HDOD domain-containing protein [Methylococcaceae bacterium]
MAINRGPDSKPTAACSRSHGFLFASDIILNLFVETLSDKLFNKLDTHRLPSLDQVLIEIIHACGSDDTSFERLAEIISTDSAMTVKILTIVNSPGHFLVRPVTTLQSALINLGIDTIKTLAITASLQKVFNGFHPGADFDSKLFWKKSLHCGLMVKELAGLTGYSKTDEAYLAGLLHNIGELVIASNFPSEFQYCRMLGTDEKLAFEQKQFGFNHYDAGAWVVGQWHLHSFISDAILYQQEPRETILDSHILVRFIFLANQLSPVEAIPDKTRFDLAEQMFGFSAGLVRKLIEKVDDSMTRIAQS